MVLGYKPNNHLSQFQNIPFCPILASGSNFNPRNTTCIHVVKIFAFLDLEQISADFEIEHFETGSSVGFQKAIKQRIDNRFKKMHKILNDIDKHVTQAVTHYWLTRKAQKDKQKNRGVSDAGLRSAVTGGAQMDGFINLLRNLVVDAGIDNHYIHEKKALELPGFFRPTKEWDLLVIKNGHLIVAIEAKSQVGPSFGNNFNNRTEEAMGSALDLWTAFRERAFNGGMQPFLGYFFMLEDCQA